MSLAGALLELRQLTERLRRECPWDAAQTERTIVPHTVEEAYEVADAALAGDDDKLVDELGDLLFQVYFLALLVEERGGPGLEAVARGLHAKLVQRHPHVFGGADARTPGDVRRRWDDIKREHEPAVGLFDGVPEALPGLLYARKLQRRAATIDFEYADVEGAIADLEDELRELKQAVAESGVRPPETEPDPHVFEEMGDVFFAAVNVARRLNVDPELAVRTMAKRFAARVDRAHELAAAAGLDFAGLSLEDKDRFFDEAKERHA